MKQMYFRLMVFSCVTLALSGCLRPQWYLMVSDSESLNYFDFKEDKQQQIGQLLADAPIDTGFYLTRKESKKMNKALYYHTLVELSDTEVDHLLRIFQRSYLKFLQLLDSTEAKKYQESVFDNWDSVRSQPYASHRLIQSGDSLENLEETKKLISAPLPGEILPVFVVKKNVFTGKQDTMLFTYCCFKQYEVMITRKKYFLVDWDFVLALLSLSL